MLILSVIFLLHPLITHMFVCQTDVVDLLTHSAPNDQLGSSLFIQNIGNQKLFFLWINESCIKHSCVWLQICSRNYGTGYMLLSAIFTDRVLWYFGMLGFVDIFTEVCYPFPWTIFASHFQAKHFLFIWTCLKSLCCSCASSQLPFEPCHL